MKLSSFITVLLMGMHTLYAATQTSQEAEATMKTLALFMSPYKGKPGTYPIAERLHQMLHMTESIALHEALVIPEEVKQRSFVSDIYITVTDDEVGGWNARDADRLDNPVNQLFTANPEARLVIDFGDKTDVGNNFGKAIWYWSYASNIPAAIRHIIIKGDGLTTVGGSFLSGCQGLTSLTLPNGLTTVGNDFFLSLCEGLTSLTLPNGLTTVGNHFLFHCTGLTSLDLSHMQITTVGESFLSDCRGLTSLTLPNGLTTVGDRFLHNCTGLKQGSVIVKNGTPTAAFFREGRYRPYVSGYDVAHGDNSFNEDPNYVMALLLIVNAKPDSVVGIKSC